MNSKLRGFPKRLSSACVSPYNTCHLSSLKSKLHVRHTVTLFPQNGVGLRPKVFLCAGIGLFVSSVYYSLANGPSNWMPTTAKPLSPLRFTPLTLTASTLCTPNTKLLTLTLPSNLIPIDSHMPIFSMYVKHPDMQIERPYTPLDGIDSHGRMRFWVKRYEDGEVGRWLHERKVGDVIEVRGPIRTWDWQDGLWDEIAMISGGTGITPFYQLLNRVFSGERPPRTRFTLLHSSPTPLDLPPAELLDSLQTFAQAYPEAFSLRLFVDSAKPPRTHQASLKPTVGRIGRKALGEMLANRAPGKRPWWRWWSSWWSSHPLKTEKEMRILFLVCGPEPMVTAIAGPRGRNEPDGRAGGVLGEIGIASKQVWRL